MRAALTVTAGSLLALACGSPQPNGLGRAEPSYVSLVEPQDWTSVVREDDPFITDASGVPSCLGPGFIVEASYVEIDTGLCSWVTLGAPAREGVAVDRGLRLVVSHYDLNAVEPAEASAQLRFGDCEVWSKIVPIPGAADVYTETFVSPCELARGALVQFHLNNHGQNNWQLRELSVLK